MILSKINILGCCLGWGATFVSTDAMGILRSIGSGCEEILLDQWYDDKIFRSSSQLD